MIGLVLPAWNSAAYDAATTAVHAGVQPDSIRMDRPPLPGGVATVFRFLFSGVPQWIQIGGVVVGAIVAVVVLFVAWKHRTEILAWLASRSTGYKAALGAGVGTTLLAAGLGGGWTYHYMMHENDFCSSCHIMSTAFGRFQKSEHSKLQCHACHRQSIFASTKELYFWVVERPDKIPSHAKVPNHICSECHVTQKRDSVWQYVSMTAGHQAHMKSDSASLKNVQCVTCHAREVHRFAPNDASCKQSGCHEQVKIKLGKMADQTSMHCATCHEFARPMTDTMSVDSAKAGLVPLRPQCFYCHEMREKLEKAGLDKDPHKAKCGACHNAHKQTKAEGAIKSCTTSQCHASADTLTAFHRGLGEHAIDDCTACHKSHTWKAKGKDCLSCHPTIFQDRPSKHRLLKKVAAPASSNPRPRALSRSSGPSAEEGGDDAAGREDAVDDRWTTRRGRPTVVPLDPARAPPRDTLKAATDTIFPHSRHKALACTTCHSSANQHGSLTLRDRAACQECHHAKERAGQCTTCHVARQLTPARTARVAIHVSTRKVDSVRTLAFEHERHGAQACATCHAEGTTKSLIKQCTSCHRDHHNVARNCIACHPSPRVAHERVTHDGCARCHRDPSAAAFPPIRTICLTCHRDQLTHYAPKECVQCHRVSWNEVPLVEEAK